MVFAFCWELTVWHRFPICVSPRKCNLRSLSIPRFRRRLFIAWEPWRDQRRSTCYPKVLEQSNPAAPPGLSFLPPVHRLVCFLVGFWVFSVRFLYQTCSETVIPAKAGIQRSGVNAVRLDSGFRRNDGNFWTLQFWCPVHLDIFPFKCTLVRRRRNVLKHTLCLLF